MQDFKVAVVQMNSTTDRELNLQHIAASVQEAVIHNADLVVFPEVVDYFGPDLPEHATIVPGEIADWFSSLAKEHQIWIHTGSITVEENGHIYNQSMVYDPQGQMQGSYRKLHMFDVEVEGQVSYKESDEITPGDHLQMVDMGFARAGLSICYDLRFPQMFADMADQGMDVMILCANFADATGKAHWNPLLRARAIENSCYVIACDQCGEKPGFSSHGHSMIIDPWGVIQAEAGTDEMILYADLSAEYLKKCREQIPSLSNRRHDIYG